MLKQILLIAALLGTSTAQAHDDATLDRAPGPNGGQLRMAGPYHLELVVDKAGRSEQESSISVYLTDHAGNPVGAQAFKGRARLLAAKQRVIADLAPSGGNRLQGRARFQADPAMKAVVAVTAADGRIEQARFEPLARAANAAAGK